MRTIIIVSALLMAVFSSAAFGADLYRVSVSSQDDAERLTAAGAEPVAAIQNGYLVLAEPGIAGQLGGAGIKMELIAASVSKDQLAIDLRLDDKNAGRFPLIYQEGGLRVYRMDQSWQDKATADVSLMPIQDERLKIEYHPSPVFDQSLAGRLDLQTLIDQVDLDSLESYTLALQAFDPRVTGSAADHASRDWIAAKFAEFGYDSIVFDTFNTPTVCENVVAYKIGISLPEHYVVVGAHRDAVSGSPGADDNGSGTAAVLEIARILKNIDTDLTFVFALFDGEEQGLLGSYHYAGEAAARGDSIVYMCNMDMIAHRDNTTNAKLYHGSVLTYTELLQHLADSLVGLTAIPYGSTGGSDHYPFIQNGYEATFLHEYEFSTVYHSPADSTTYMKFPYMTKMVKAALATVYTVSETHIPGPQLRFTYPDGVPSELTPGESTVFRVVVTGINEGVPVAGSGRLHYSVNGGPQIESAMPEPFPNQYQATLPGVSCGDLISFYFSAEEADSGLFYNPDASSPYEATPVTGDSVVFADDFEQDRGWSYTGAWQRGSPTGGGGSHGGPDPTGGHGSPACAGYNLSGDYANSLPERNLTSPAIDCSGLSGVRLRYWRWLGVEQPQYDHAYIRISNNGSTWTTVWQNTSEVADYAWVLQEIDISHIADNQPAVYLRWTMGTTDYAWTYCGWNIDDVEVIGNICDASPAPLRIVTESVPDWTAGHPYSRQLAAVGGVGAYTWSDKFNDLAGTGLTLGASGLVSGIPMVSGPLSFTAVVTDEGRTSAEKVFSVTINPALDITTVSLPNAVVGEPYSHQLEALGGTGVKIWTDKSLNLPGSGLTLSGAGLLSGTPLAIGPIAFTAKVEDAVGSSDEQFLVFAVVEAYACGDVNDDGDVNLADAVYIVNYIFKGGPAPNPVCVGNADGDGDVNLADAVYLINYVFKGGPPPVDPCCP